MSGLEAAGKGEAVARAIRAEDELERFFELSIDMLCVASYDGYFTRVNPSFERILGHPTEELLREPFLQFVHPDDRAATLAELAALNEGARTVSFENRYRCADGGYRWLQWTSKSDLERRVVYAVARDVTELKRAEAELQTLLAGQAALRRVATLVAREGKHGAVFRLVPKEVARLLGARSASIVRYEAEGRGLVIGGWSAPGAARLPPGSLLELHGETAAGRVRQTGEAARVSTFEGAEGSLGRALRDMGFRSAIGAPIHVDGTLWGAIVTSSMSEEPWPEDAERRLTEFAELVSQALANADAREQLSASRARLVEASDAERRRLERNLHDGAQQRLVAVSLTIRLAEARLAVEPGEAQALLAGAREELAVALAELRELAQGIHPSVLVERGLAPALQTVASRAPIPVEVLSVPSGRLPPSVEIAAYYLVSEALANVAKHAQASRATVAVDRSGDRVTIEVSDDGVGGADANGGSGLRGLADRISTLAGSLDVVSPPGGGTTVRAAIPCS
ncbi:MAG: PAS domain S-box protein [Actinobacteria bacterium]|nr:PAS domain S-box protein [Actinomycetota bacterium]